MTILTNNHIGGVRTEGFFDLHNNAWVSDPFTVSHQIDNGTLEITVVFTTPTGDRSFGWCLKSLKSLKHPPILIDLLFDHGVRIVPTADAVALLLTAIQKPELIIKWSS